MVSEVVKALRAKKVAAAAAKKKSSQPKNPNEPPAPRVNKRGRLSLDERRYIERYSESLSDERMAEYLKRPTESVRNYRVEFLGKGAGVTPDKAVEVQIKISLRERPEWASRKNEFSGDELEIFENSYVNLMRQFKDDVLPTEEKQIFQAIELEIFMHRNKRSRYTAMESIETLRKLIDKEKQKDVPDDDLLLDMERQIMASEAALQTADKAYTGLSDRYGSIIKDLKGTREQRIKKAEESKRTIFDVIRELETKEKREAAGFDIETHRIAMEAEKERLGALYKYDNGEYDRPLLNAETIDMAE